MQKFGMKFVLFNFDFAKGMNKFLKKEMDLRRGKGIGSEKGKGK